MVNVKYVRFVISTGRGRHATGAGVLVAACDLTYSGGLPQHSRSQIIELLTWFSSNLKVPARFNRGGGKGWYRRDTRGLSWFKPQAKECLSNMRDLSLILDQHDVLTLQIEETVSATSSMKMSTKLSPSRSRI